MVGLCEKAPKWKEEAETDELIRQSTAHMVLPFLRSTRKDFGVELRRRERKILSKRGKAAGKSHRKCRAEGLRQQKVDAEEEQLAN